MSYFWELRSTAETFFNYTNMGILFTLGGYIILDAKSMDGQSNLWLGLISQLTFSTHKIQLAPGS